jgi:hypothetical protein
MIGTTKMMALCAFVFGLSFASAVFARDCVTECKRAAIAQCLLIAAEGEAEACYTADYSYCRRVCGVNPPQE